LINPSHKKIVVGICGASGAIYAQRLLDLLDQCRCAVYVIVSDVGRQLLADELGISELTAEAVIGRDSAKLNFCDNGDLFHPLASGSVATDAMIICPCSSHSIAAIAGGLANTLLLRSAYVSLKQRRPLLLIHRETPLTQIDLENMLRISRAGGIISPAAPAFYMKPKTISDLVDSVAGRVLDLLEIDHDLPIRWSR